MFAILGCKLLASSRIQLSPQASVHLMKALQCHELKSQSVHSRVAGCRQQSRTHLAALVAFCWFTAALVTFMAGSCNNCCFVVVHGMMCCSKIAMLATPNLVLDGLVCKTALFSRYVLQCNSLCWYDAQCRNVSCMSDSTCNSVANNWQSNPCQTQL